MQPDQPDYEDNVAWRLVGATVIAFGANDAGEIFLAVKEKSGRASEFVIGKEGNDLTLFEIERKEIPA